MSRRRSTSAARCRPASRCSRRARGRARRTRSRRWRRATWPRACRWTSCCWSRSRAWPRASCATACASGWSRAERALASASAPRADDVVRLLADGSPEVVAQRRERLVRALADFDAATIATTHGFCQEVLGGLGVAGDLEPDATLVEDVGDLLGEVVDDLYVRRYMTGEDAPRISRARGDADRARDGRATRARRSSRATRPAPDLPALRARLAASVRDELERRKRRAVDHHLRRSADAAARRAARAGGGRRAAAARALPRRAGRRVPGHRPDPVGDPAARVRRRRDDAGADRRPETGDLRLPRRRRLLVPGGGRGGRRRARRWRSTGAATRR